MDLSHTAGPWRWEFNAKDKEVHLVGGRPQYDLTIMDFTRWGMGGAGIRLRDVRHNGLNVMEKLHERPDWVAPFFGREHHADWRAAVTHPDMRLIEAAPELYELVELVHQSFGGGNVITFSDEDISRFAEVVAKARGTA